jgi:hypothetical protein
MALIIHFSISGFSGGIMKKWKECPLLFAVIIVGVLLSIVGVLELRGSERHGISDWMKTPTLAVFFQNIGEDRTSNQQLKPEKNSASVQPATEVAKSSETTKNSEEAQPKTATVDKTYHFQSVDQSYFNDALFIGDSRTVGLCDYSGWNNATYYASIGLTVYDMFKKPIVAENGGKITIEQALGEHKYGKIYLMVGINEMGTGTIDSFMQTYQNAVSHLQALQPDAIIFVEGIMYVKQEKSEKDPIFNNPNIKARNDRIAQLADNRKIFYIDVNEVVTDETGNLNPAYTFDEVHLLGKYYSIWTDFLLKHGIVKE